MNNIPKIFQPPPEDYWMIEHFDSLLCSGIMATPVLENIEELRKNESNSWYIRRYADGMREFTVWPYTHIMFFDGCPDFYLCVVVTSIKKGKTPFKDYYKYIYIPEPYLYLVPYTFYMGKTGLLTPRIPIEEIHPVILSSPYINTRENILLLKDSDREIWKYDGTLLHLGRTSQEKQ